MTQIICFFCKKLLADGEQKEETACLACVRKKLHESIDKTFTTFVGMYGDIITEKIGMKS